MVSAAAANLLWLSASAPAWLAFEQALNDPEQSQENILRRLMRENANTAFGREHGFADIRTPEQYARKVPPRDYDQFESYVRRIVAGKKGVLTAAPVVRLVPTSGSTAARKLIPYTAAMQAELNRAVAAWIFDLFRTHPGAMRGPAYWSISPATSFAAPEASAVPIGFDDDSAYLGWRKHFLPCIFAVPNEVKKIPSIDAWRYVTLLLLLRRRDLSLISVWHPSFLQLLLSAMASAWPRLIRDIGLGSCDVADQLPESLAAFVYAKPNRRRAWELEQCGPNALNVVWPRLRVVSCWTDAQAQGAAAGLAANLSGIAIQPKGLLATEGVISIPIGQHRPCAVRSHFLEFEDEAGKISIVGDLKIGGRYSVLISNGGGLFRYRLNDLVEVDGRLGRTPSIRFAGKAGVVSDLRGEKLTDGFVCQVLARLFAGLRTKPSFSMLAPSETKGHCRYVLYVASTAPAIDPVQLDLLLRENPHYAYCRHLGQLAAPVIHHVGEDAFSIYARRLQHTQALGDIKPVGLSPQDWAGYFSRD